MVLPSLTPAKPTPSTSSTHCPAAHSSLQTGTPYWQRPSGDTALRCLHRYPPHTHFSRSLPYTSLTRTCICSTYTSLTFICDTYYSKMCNGHTRCKEMLCTGGKVSSMRVCVAAQICHYIARSIHLSNICSFAILERNTVEPLITAMMMMMMIIIHLLLGQSKVKYIISDYINNYITWTDASHTKHCNNNKNTCSAHSLEVKSDLNYT